MKIKIFFMIFGVTVSTLLVSATTVEWNQMHSSYYYLEDWGEVSKWHVLGGNLERSVYFEFWCDAYFHVTALNDDPNWVSVWVRQMSRGDIVNEESMLGEGLTYYYRSEKGKTGSHSDYDIGYDDSHVYLGLCAETFAGEAYYVYGWVELGWGEIDWPPGPGLEVFSSAWDLDGGPMVVGGGSALTPEPSSALLLLVGCALLALRRRTVL